MAKLKVRNLMTESVFSIQADEDLARLNDLMDDLQVRHVPVVNSDGDVVGLVSQRDLIRRVLYTSEELTLNEQRDLLQEMLVQEIMVPDPETVDPETEIDEAGRIMLDNKLGCLPVVEDEHLVGILTEADFVKYVSNHPQE